MKQQPPIPRLCSCISCKRLLSNLTLTQHFKLKHGTEEHKNNYSQIQKNKMKAFHDKTTRVKHEAQKEEYLKNPKFCKQCLTLIVYERRGSKFCNSSCAATFHNLGSTHSVETKNKIAKTLTKEIHKKKKTWRDDIVGQFSKLFRCTCKKSGAVFLYRKPIQFDPRMISSKDDYYRACKFSFSLKTYPEYFADDIELIKTFGMYSTPGRMKDGISNPDGVSRDHMYSITDGWLNEIDPKIISHPANCKVMSHKSNSKKNMKSSITLSELKLRIDKFNKMYL